MWVDKGMSIRSDTLQRFRDSNPAPRIVHFSPDDMLNPLYLSRHYIDALPDYDLHVPTKSYSVE